MLDVTSTLTTHEAWALLIVAPATAIEPPPAAAVTTAVPDGQVVVTFGVAATNTLAGSVSVKLMPDCAGLPAPLVRVKEREGARLWFMHAGASDVAFWSCTTFNAGLPTPLVSAPPTV